MRSGAHFHLCVLITLLAWHPCHADDALTSAQAKWDQKEKETDAAFTKYQDAQKKTWEEVRQRVLKKWSDGKLPQEKTYVEYFDGDSARVQVDYENGKVTVEALLDPKDPSATIRSAKDKISKALSSVVSPDSASTDAVLSTDEISGTSGSTQELAESLSKNAEAEGVERGGDGQERGLYRVTFKLVPDYVKRRAAKYKPTVDVWAKKYNLDPAFILAIMRQESAFNPRARSWVGALGLMQIYPPYAGKEVFKIVKHQDATPSDDFLYEPKNNIMMGTTFLQILRDRYFADIKDKDKQRYLITCGYNWSAGRLRKAIAKGRLSIRAPASEVFDRLEQITPDETKGYLKRVTQFTREFRGD